MLGERPCARLGVGVEHLSERERTRLVARPRCAHAVGERYRQRRQRADGLGELHGNGDIREPVHAPDQFVQGSAKYRTLGSLARLVVDVLVNADCQILTGIGPKLAPAQKTTFIAAYRQATQTLATQGWLTSGQASTLGVLAGGL